MEVLFQALHAIQPMSESLIEHLKGTLQEKTIAKKEYLLTGGKVADRMYFITSGLLRGYYLKQDTDVSAWFMKEGDVCTSVESFFVKQPSHDFIQALETTSVYFISYEELQYVYQAFPEFNIISRVLTEKYYRLSEERLFMLRMQSGRERYEYLLTHHPDLVSRVPQKYLASYLDMTEVTLSKVRGKK